MEILLPQSFAGKAALADRSACKADFIASLTRSKASRSRSERIVFSMPNSVRIKWFFTGASTCSIIFLAQANRASVEDEHIFRIFDGPDKTAPVCGNPGQAEESTVSFLAQFHSDPVGHLTHVRRSGAPDNHPVASFRTTGIGHKIPPLLQIIALNRYPTMMMATVIMAAKMTSSLTFSTFLKMTISGKEIAVIAIMKARTVPSGIPLPIRA